MDNGVSSIIGTVQQSDLKLEEERVLRERDERHALQRQANAESLNDSELLARLVPSELLAQEGRSLRIPASTEKEDAGQNPRSPDAFPPPPRG